MENIVYGWLEVIIDEIVEVVRVVYVDWFVNILFVGY